jgi:hypothetical protein
MHLHKSRRHLKYISEHLLRSLVSSKGPVPDAIVMCKVAAYLYTRESCYTTIIEGSINGMEGCYRGTNLDRRVAISSPA